MAYEDHTDEFNQEKSKIVALYDEIFPNYRATPEAQGPPLAWLHLAPANH